MSKLEFLEANQNFKSYYKTLRDLNNFLSSSPELQTANQTITQLIFEFIRVNGVTFREMDRGQFEREYQIFQEDLLNIIQNSGENNVDFNGFASLLDEIIVIANLRQEALGKIQRTKLESPLGNADEDEDESSEEALEINVEAQAEISEILNTAVEETNEEDNNDPALNSNNAVNEFESSDDFSAIAADEESKEESIESSSDGDKYRTYRRYR
ncbi:hypothetical protein PH210_08855 [Paenibacillus sp. BSR1-1]|uniref:hypothetical protein n=1 Tax=Paenibacillus sp. BSR1-1 TaxID=3020845 RepID=UPI0025AF7233|nr:hypothetical protein [Paenibacillus sp. BSR1-1]MDN3016307.1 hypothetical protein [Paenibacillus sp. BSR1-1]